MNEHDQILGIVRDGEFTPLVPPGLPARLTRIDMQAAVPPESQEIDMTDYEGLAVMVEGHDGGGWIYSAAVIDQAGPILTAVVREVFASQAASEVKES